MTRPIVSIVIPTRNRAHLLPRALHSVLQQTFRSLEVVLVDDGSTDRTSAVVERLGESRVRYFRQEATGATVARNQGVRIARGTYITFLDSDDEAHPEWLEEMVGRAQASNSAIVFCGVELRDETGGITGFRYPRPLGPLFDDWHGSFLAGSFLLTRELFEESGGYCEELSAGQHTELGFRLVDTCRRLSVSSAHVNRCLVIYHRHPGVRIRNDSRARLEATEFFLNHHGTRLRKDPEFYVNARSTAAHHALLLGERRRARRHALAALRAQPWQWKNGLRWLCSYLPESTYRRLHPSHSRNSKLLK